MKETLEEQAELLMKSELEKTNQKFPPFNSAHEGFAFISERVDRTNQEMAYMNDNLGEVWGRLKQDALTETPVKIMCNTAVKAACEAIQTAAMCCKLMDFINMKNER